MHVKILWVISRLRLMLKILWIFNRLTFMSKILWIISRLRFASEITWTINRLIHVKNVMDYYLRLGFMLKLALMPHISTDYK